MLRHSNNSRLSLFLTCILPVKVYNPAKIVKIGYAFYIFFRAANNTIGNMQS